MGRRGPGGSLDRSRFARAEVDCQSQKHFGPLGKNVSLAHEYNMSLVHVIPGESFRPQPQNIYSLCKEKEK